MAPISNSITIADVTLPILLLIPSSKADQRTLNSHIDSQTAMPVASSRATWLAPCMESLPSMLTLNASMAISTTIGIRDMRAFFIA